MFLGFDEGIHTVEGNTAVVADDAAAAVGVGKTGDDVAVTGGADGCGVHVEDTVVVCLAVFGEDVLQVFVNGVAVGLEGLDDHAPTTVGHDGTLEGGVGLQTNDEFVVLVDVAGCVGGDA